MSSIRLLALIFVFLVLTEGAWAQDSNDRKADCPYEIFEICDPFVPGIIVTKDGEVYDVWPHNPAEKSGICPGDLVVRINDEPFSVKAAVSSQPIPIRIAVKRNGEEFEKLVGRVKESELRILSGMKRLQTESGGVSVPSYQTQELPPILQNQITNYSGSWARLSFSTQELPVIFKNHITYDLGPYARLSFSSRKYSIDKYFLGMSLIFLSDKKKVIVERVQYPSPAYDARLELGDQVLSINGKETKGMRVEELRGALEPSQHKIQAFEIGRKSGTILVNITPIKISEALARIDRKLTYCGIVPINCTCTP